MRIRNADMAFHGIQKGVLAAMSALALLAELIGSRSKENQDLDDQGLPLLDSLHTLGAVHNNISVRRRECLKTQISPVYLKALNKGSDSPKWLFRVNLEKATKQRDVAKKIRDKVLRGNIRFPLSSRRLSRRSSNSSSILTRCPCSLLSCVVLAVLILRFSGRLHT